MRRDSAEALERMFGRLAREYGCAHAEKITQVLAEEIGGMRLVFPSLADMARMVRNQAICDSFTGRNYEELGLQYGRHPVQIRRIIQGQGQRGRG